MQAIAVTGPVEAGRLGITLPHEHLNVDSRFLCTAPSRGFVPVDEVPLAVLRSAPMEFVDNLDLRDEEIATDEATRFARAGGTTLVDLTTKDIGRDPAVLRRIAERTGLNVIMATGYYVHGAHPPELADATVDTIAAEFVGDLTAGIDGVRAGVIGEIGTSDPLHPDEAKVVRAAARAHLATGCPINIHFAAGCREVFAVIDLLRGEGVSDLSRVVMSHMDVSIDLEQQRTVAELGAMVEYDTFGHESYPDSRGRVMPRDEERVDALAQLSAWGLLDRVLISHDVCLKFLWQRFGGHGYVNLLDRVRPLMTAAGLGPAAQDQLLVINPARLLAYAPDATVEGRRTG